MVAIGTPLAAVGNEFGITYSTVWPVELLAFLGLFMFWHGYNVYSGKVPVQPPGGRALSRPDIDLSAGWCGAGLALWGLGWLISIPPFLPTGIVGQIVAWAGAAVFLFGVASYMYMPAWLRPIWAGKATTAPTSTAGPTADEAQPTADEAATAAPPAD